MKSDFSTNEIRLRSALRRSALSTRIPPRNSLSPLEEWMCRVIGGHLISWMKEEGPALLAEREMLARMAGLSTKPTVVIETSVPGLIAAREIFGRRSSRVTWISDRGSDHLAESDPMFVHHVRLRSTFTEQISLGLGGASLVWLYHETVSTMGTQFVRGARHRWRWNGKELILEQEGEDRWVG